MKFFTSLYQNKKLWDKSLNSYLFLCKNIANLNNIFKTKLGGRRIVQ